MSALRTDSPVPRRAFGTREAWLALGIHARLNVLRDAPRAAGPDEKHAGARVGAWRSQRALDGISAIVEPTHLYKCDARELHRIAAAVAPGDILHHPNCDWVAEFNAAWEAAATSNTSLLERDDTASPFLLLIEPLIVRALQRVHSHAASVADPFMSPSDAVTRLKPMLYDRLEPLVTRAAVVEMHAARLKGALEGCDSATRFKSFIQKLPRLRDEAIREYPVLGHLALAVTNNWACAMTTFITALSQDWSDLRNTFSLSARDELVSVVSVGDFHRGGQSVLSLTFRSGRRLIFKPRCVEVEAEFQRLLAWLCRKRGFPSLRELSVLARSSYGWVEYVEAAPCPTAEIPDLYRRRGALLAILYALSAADCHYENVISSGAQPVVLDLEALFHVFPVDERPGLGHAERAVLDSTVSSVLGTGFLPMRRWSNAFERSVDVSALGGQASELIGARRVHWKNERTDEMREVVESTMAIPEEPVALPLDHSLANWADAVCAGFATAYGVIVANRDELLSDHGPLARFADLETRCIVRPTGHYLYLLQSLSHPSFLSDGLRFDRRLDQLIGTEPFTPDVAAAERHDLSQMDVPIPSRVAQTVRTSIPRAESTSAVSGLRAASIEPRVESRACLQMTLRASSGSFG